MKKNSEKKMYFAFFSKKNSYSWKKLATVVEDDQKAPFSIVSTYFLIMLRVMFIGLMSRVFTNGPGYWILGQVIPKTQKMDDALLNTQHYKDQG